MFKQKQPKQIDLDLGEEIDPNNIPFLREYLVDKVVLFKLGNRIDTKRIGRNHARRQYS